MKSDQPAQLPDEPVLKLSLQLEVISAEISVFHWGYSKIVKQTAVYVDALRAAAVDLEKRLTACETALIDESDKKNNAEQQLREAHARVGELEKAILAIANDGWLMHGVEGMDDVQKQVWTVVQQMPAYKAMAALGADDAK